MLSSFASSVWNGLKFNLATLSGSSDIIVIRKSNGKVASTAFHVRFGRTKTLWPLGQKVSIRVNGVLTGVTMELGQAGEARFFNPNPNQQTDLERYLNEEYSITSSAANDDYYQNYNNPKADIESINGNVQEYKSTESTSSILSSCSKVSTMQVRASLCGNLLKGTPESFADDMIVFEKNLLSWSDFDNEPALWLHTATTFQLEENGPFLPARVALPVLVSLTMYNRSISPTAFMQLSNCKIKLLVPRKKSDVGKEKRLYLLQKQKEQQKTDLASKDSHSTYSMKPTEEQLLALMLKPGPNILEFVVESKLLGRHSIMSTAYLWDEDVKLIVSDVDGTITKSDVWGQVAPIIGRDWSQKGVTQLFSLLADRGYKIVYVTARAIGQAISTRDYLFSLMQDSNSQLPDGPLFLSPDRLFTSLKREVIEKSSIVFKKAALNDIVSLFSKDKSPLYAGFGNRPNDYLAYEESGIDPSRIFIIDVNGSILNGKNSYKNAYEALFEELDDIFPIYRSEYSSYVTQQSLRRKKTILNKKLQKLKHLESQNESTLNLLAAEKNELETSTAKETDNQVTPDT